MKYSLEIECDNAAFDPQGDGDEQAARDQVALILRDLAKHLENGCSYRILQDSNGNRVGVAEFNP